MFNAIYKISKWYLNRPTILRKDYAQNWLKSLNPKSYTIVTSPSAWNYFKNSDRIEPKKILLNPSLEIDELDKILPRIGTEWIIGIGSGRMMDISKYLAWKLKKDKINKKIKLCLIPSITSTTSWLNMAIAVRKHNELVMAGDYHAQLMIFDPEYISSAPSYLNTGGLADLAASANAVSDWIRSNEKTGEKISKKGCDEFKKFCENLFNNTEKLVPFTTESTIFIFEKFLDALSLCGASMSGRPVEGGEHFLYYCIDEIDDRLWNHGQIIALTTLICLKLQVNHAVISAESLKQYFDTVGIKFRMRDQNIKPEYLINAIVKMEKYVKTKNYYYTIWNQDDLIADKSELNQILDWIEK